MCHGHFDCGVWTGIHCKNVWVLRRVRPIGHLCESLGCHVINQSTEQFGNVACQVGLDRLVLDPCVLDGIVQGAHVLIPMVHGKICVLAVQQFMHNKTCVALQITEGQHCVITHVSETHGSGIDSRSLRVL